MTPEERFHRADAPCFGSKIANRIDFYGGSRELRDPTARRLYSVGDFVSQEECSRPVLRTGARPARGREQGGP